MNASQWLNILNAVTATALCNLTWTVNVIPTSRKWIRQDKCFINKRVGILLMISQKRAIFEVARSI